MNLIDLQMQLRSIEEQIAALQAEIEKMKPQVETEQKIDHNRITALARQHPVGGGAFEGVAVVSKVLYLACLSHVACADKANLEGKLYHLCRLAQGIGVAYSSEELQRMGLAFDRDDLEKVCTELRAQRYALITDALILANLAGEAAEETYQMIADLAHMLECGKEELRVMGCVAKAVLLDDPQILGQIARLTQNVWMGQLRQYIPREWLASQRRYCGKYCVSVIPDEDAEAGHYFGLLALIHSETTKPDQPFIVSKRLEPGCLVRRGEVIVAGEEVIQLTFEQVAAKVERNHSLSIDEDSIFKNMQEKKPVEITALSDGIVYYAEDTEGEHILEKKETRKYVHVYVCSYFDDRDSFEQWIQDSKR